MASASVNGLDYTLKFSRRARLAEGSFWVLAGLFIAGWAAILALDLKPSFDRTVAIANFASRHSGATALLLSLVLLAIVSLLAGVSAFRAKAIPQPSASVLLVTAASLRSIQLLSEGVVTPGDATILSALVFAAALLYFGSQKLWWFVLMPLASAASFTPLVYLEFFKGASEKTLMMSLTYPAAAFFVSSILIVARDLRSRTSRNQQELRRLKTRGQASLRDLHAMETEMKSLQALLAKRRTFESAAVLSAPVEPVAVIESIEPAVAEFAALAVPSETTDFNSPLSDLIPSETVSFDDIDQIARHLLDEARTHVHGRPVRLNLTAPTESNFPIAVRGERSQLTLWLKSLILQSIEALGGFPNGVVRVTLKPGLNAIAISVEDNGRGIGELAQAKQGQIDGRLKMIDIRDAVERVGGRFDVQARLGVGARVTIELPRIDAFAHPPRTANVRSGLMAVTGGSSQRASSLPHA